MLLTMSAALDYRGLLNEVVPHVIHDDAGHQHALAQAERLSGLLAEQPNTALEDMIELLATLIEKYEQETIGFPQTDPLQILAHLMESGGMNQQQFAHAVGLSTAHVSNMLSGARPITIEQARNFGEYFSVAPSLFLGIE
jgi:HTH-type transcriptional regulator/antitoxin HigA